MTNINTMVKQESPNKNILAILESFKRETKLTKVDYEEKVRSENNYLIIYLNNPNKRFFEILEKILDSLPEDNLYKFTTTIKKRRNSPLSRLDLPEVQLLRTVLSGSLTVDQHSFSDDFFDRYIRSVSGDEDQIISQSNHIVYGRRGSGKSSLLAYLMHQLRKSNSPYAWISIQTYSGRRDNLCIVEVFIDVIEQLKNNISDQSLLEGLIELLENIYNLNDDKLILSDLDKLIPRIRRVLGRVQQNNGAVFLFLDDLHVLSKEIQPTLLDKLYSVCRGNRIFLKISGIEQFVRLRDASTRKGLETPSDIQVITLDYNLTQPDKSEKHIHDILDSYASYCGISNINYICRGGVIGRIVWVSAGVPRDALYLFSQAISESTLKDHQKVSVTSVNIAASNMTEEKLKDVENDALGQYDDLKIILTEIHDFCITKERKNAFLVEIDNNDIKYKKIEELIALRFLHILNRGFTRSSVAQRYLALMFDYGFYVGLRTAASIDLFSKEPQKILASELRKLPVFLLKSSNGKT